MLEYLGEYNNKEVAFITYLLLINIISFIAMLTDKLKARKDKYRVSEATLIVLALIGGGSGTLLGMIMCKHKTQKKKFYIGIPIIYILNRFIETIIFNYLR